MQDVPARTTTFQTRPKSSDVAGLARSDTPLYPRLGSARHTADGKGQAQSRLARVRRKAYIVPGMGDDRGAEFPAPQEFQRRFQRILHRSPRLTASSICSLFRNTVAA